MVLQEMKMSMTNSAVTRRPTLAAFGSGTVAPAFAAPVQAAESGDALCAAQIRANRGSSPGG